MRAGPGRLGGQSRRTEQGVLAGR